MKYENSHLSDQQMLLDIDGELSAHEAKLVRAHLVMCWRCRARRQELETAITDFIHLYERQSDKKLPPVAGARASLKAQLAQLSATEPEQRPVWFALARRFAWGLAAAVCGLLAFVFLIQSERARHNQSRHWAMVVSTPNATLTPGAALLVGPKAVCAQANNKNKAVPVALRRKVFEEYGITGDEPQAYEVDYLVTPALGGADDIHNLWPHSYSATVWNARVKDALEDRLREMVCDGSLDLTEAQREIAANWIAAYKKYFHTDRPLEEHRGQVAR